MPVASEFNRTPRAQAFFIDGFAGPGNQRFHIARRVERCCRLEYDAKFFAIRVEDNDIIT